MSAFVPALLRRPEVSRRTGLSRTTIYRMVQAGEFPAPRQLGSRAVAWSESEISAWIESRTVGTRSTGAQAA
jgi:prophage regulatory protein